MLNIHSAVRPPRTNNESRLVIRFHFRTQQWRPLSRIPGRVVQLSAVQCWLTARPGCAIVEIMHDQVQPERLAEQSLYMDDRISSCPALLAARTSRAHGSIEAMLVDPQKLVPESPIRKTLRTKRQVHMSDSRCAAGERIIAILEVLVPATQTTHAPGRMRGWR